MDPSGSKYVRRSEAVRVWLLGGFRVSVGSRTIEEGTWRLRKAAALVKLLALAPGHRMHREQAMDILWPDSGRRAASNNLRRVLHTTRRVLDPDAGSRYLSSREESLVLCPEGNLWVDTEAFKEAAVTARRAREPAAYQVALELYGGELLPGDRYEEWAENRREELRRLYLELLVELAGVYEECREHEKGVGVLRMVVEEEPSLEEAHAALMRLYVFLGREGEALVQYERLRGILSRERGAQPSTATRLLQEEIAAGRFPPKEARALGSTAEEPAGVGKHNLPAARTSFVGREREMLEVKRELAMTRLLTLTGVGGSGKTRLALEVARDLAEAYPDGVWFVELAGLSKGNLVAQTVAGALEVQEQPGEPLTDTLVRHLREKDLLLVLDNCEHLVEAAACLVDTLLDSCPVLRILATSREALRVAGEVRWTVPTLSLPDLRRSPTVSELEGSEAVRLFAQRARHRNPTFVLVPEEARALAEICQRLDGVPLAIELAAARTEALSVKQISEKLSDSLALLTHGERTAVPRQRTLRGALDWSYELLGKQERMLFERLSVFMDGWTLEAAEVVGSAGIEGGDTLEALSKLVDKSLVVAQTSGEGQMRYGMLEPVRQYARERLEASEEAGAALRRHAAFFLALAEEAEPEFRGPRQLEWTRRFEKEHGNFRAAISWSLQSGEVSLGLQLAGALEHFWNLRGYFGEGRGWLEAALVKGSRAPAAVRAKALSGVGWIAYWQGDFDRATTAAKEGFALISQTGKGGRVASDLLNLMAGMADWQGDHERAIGLFEEGVRVSRGAGDRWGLAMSLTNLASVMRDRGAYERAAEHYEEAVMLSREAGFASLLAETLLNLGQTYLFQGDYERATVLNEEAAALCREQWYRGGLEAALNNLGWAALLRADHERAEALYKESLALCQELGDRLISHACLDGLACVTEAQRGDAKRVARLFGAAEALRQAQGITQLPAEWSLREPYLLATRSRVEETTWGTMIAEGKAMMFAEALEYALFEEEPGLPACATPEQPSVDELSAALTRREKEVATLVTRGLTNRQIAQELVISERTVDNHVSNILRKGGLRSREQVTAEMAE